MKKKLLTKISIPLIVLGILLAPISPIFENHGGSLEVGVKKNEVKAVAGQDVQISVTNLKSTTASIAITINNIDATVKNYDLTILGFDKEFDTTKSIPDGVTKLYGYSQKITDTTTATQIFNAPNVTNLTPNNTYFILVTLTKPNFYTATTIGAIVGGPIVAGINYFIFDNSTDALKVTHSFTTPDVSGNGGTTGTTQIVQELDFNFDCGLSGFSVGGCVSNLLYIIWEASAWIAEKAGAFLDFFVYYSTNSTSYSNGFVTQGWGAVRDIANIFFIIALLYIAIKTILSLGSSSKKLIGTIVIVALLINFSLFFTEVIIDGSNILAKVFYNNITAVNTSGGTVIATGGEKSISVGLVSLFNPQKLISSETYKAESGHSKFIFLTLLAIAIVLYAAYVFFAVALLFVGRVVMLWISMIFSPIAFASYTLPFNIPGIGHREWWSELLKNAFLAPLFIFFLYIIVMFATFLPNLVQYSAGSTITQTQSIMSIVIPFAILAILLMKAKSLAVRLSGELGAAISKAGGAVAGIAGGAVLGGAALVGSGVIGGASSALLRSKTGESLKTAAEQKGLAGFAARLALKTTTGATKASFDVRKTAAGGALSKSTGVNLNQGIKTKEGGFKGEIERRTKKSMAELETHKTTMTNDEVAKLGMLNSKGDKITTAEMLNNHRIEKFNENLGKTGLISSVAYSAVRAGDKTINKMGVGKTIEEEARENLKTKNVSIPNYKPTPEEIQAESDKVLDKRAKTTKLLIGATLIAAGGVVGGIGGAHVGAEMLAGGVAGGVIGATVGAGAVTGEAFKLAEEERATRATLGKQIKSMGDIEKRLVDLKESLDKNNAFLEGGNNISKEKDVNGNDKPIEFVTGDKDKGFTVNTDKIEETLARLAISAKKEDLKLKELIKVGKEDTVEGKKIQETLIKNTIEVGKLNKLKNSTSEVNNIKNQIYNITKDKNQLGTTSKTNDIKSPISPSTPPTPPSPTK